MRPSQLKRLKITDDARAAQAKVPTHEHHAEKANGDIVLEVEQVDNEAETARQEAGKTKLKQKMPCVVIQILLQVRSLLKLNVTMQVQIMLLILKSFHRP